MPGPATHLEDLSAAGDGVGDVGGDLLVERAEYEPAEPVVEARIAYDDSARHRVSHCGPSNVSNDNPGDGGCSEQCENSPGPGHSGTPWDSTAGLSGSCLPMITMLGGLQPAPGVKGFVDEDALVEEAVVVGFDFEPADADGEQPGAERVGV